MLCCALFVEARESDAARFVEDGEPYRWRESESLKEKAVLRMSLVVSFGYCQ